MKRASRNPKPEIRNPKESRSSKSETPAVLAEMFSVAAIQLVRILKLEFLWFFGIRILCVLWVVLAVVNISYGQSPRSTNAVSREGRVYLLSPNDVIEVKVYQEDDLTTKGRVAKDGTLTLPLVGVVKVGGKSVEAASAFISELYGKDYLVNPQVGVTILDYAKRNFTVLGQVQRPGSYEIPNEQSIDLLRAIATGGGFTRIGNPSNIIVQREVDGAKKIFKLDAKAMANDKNAKPFEILPEDVVTVGEKFL